MHRAQVVPPSRRRPNAPGGGPPAAVPPWAAILVGLGVLTWVRVFGTGFAQDDFRWLLRATGEEPFSLTAPRVLSMSLYFRVFHAVFGTQAAAYHAFGLLLHVATAFLLYRVLARRLPPGLSAAAAAVFVTSPALFTALHWVSGVADLLCSVLLVLAVWWLTRPGAAGHGGWPAVVAFALALASKEIAVGAAPALVVLHLHRGGPGRWARAVLTVALAVLFALPATGAWQTGAGEPYALAPAAALRNLPGFTAAAVLGGVAYAEPSDLAWGRQPWVLATGAGLLALWGVALAVRRSGPAWLGFLWFAGLLAPVAMLERQFHFYYLTCALPGLVSSVAFLAAGRGGSVPRAAGWAAAALVVAQCAAVEARSGARLRLAPLPADFVLRRAEIARNAARDLEAARGALRPRVVMLGQQPVDAARGGMSTTEATDYTRDPWWDENVRSALSNGEAVRLLFPEVREVAFKPWLTAEDTNSTIAAYQIDGHLTVADYAAFVGEPPAAPGATLAQRLERAARLIRRRLFREALEELRAADREWPDHPDVLVNAGALQFQLGDSSGALATLRRATEVAPRDVDARYNLGLLQWRLGRQAEARATWERLLTEAPDSDLGRAVRDLLAGRAR